LQDEPVTDTEEDRERFLEHAPPLIEGEGGEEILVVSPYLLPGDEYYASFKKYVDRGVKVRVLTGSMGANNQPAAHAHYRGHRRRLIRTGVELYELRHDPSPELREYTDSYPARNGWVGLHMKGFTGDRKRCFIGTLNLDPRSFRINTECGLMIDSPGLAGEMAEHIDFMMGAENSWEVLSEREGGKGALRWESKGEEVSIQPARTLSQRVGDFFYGLLPIEEQL
jgi:putative cardiolipin synthase